MLESTLPFFLKIIDEKLNDYGYMVPGLGDDVDILFGTLFGAKRIKLVNLVAAPERISVVQNIIVLLIYMLKLGDLFYY